MKTEDNILDDLYVIAPVFNPASYKSRTDLYYQFESHMKSSNINLITIECIYGDQTEFNVTKKNNKNHIQLKTKNPLWHKENLINIAIRKLPSNWKYVLWLDADIEFLETDWAIRVIEAFKKYEIIQVFKYAHFLGPCGESMEAHFSFTYSIAEDLPISRSHYNIFYPHPGYGWGMTRGAYEHLDGLIQCGILGSGDSHMAFSLIGRYSDSLSFPEKMYTVNFCKKIADWQEKVKIFYHTNKIGYADCVIKHHFHGYKEDRQYVRRMKILIEGKYDPFTDLITDESGLLQLRETREIMINDIYTYFANRKEDIKENMSYKPAVDFRTPEEILTAAFHLKKLIEVEKFNKIAKEFSEKKKATKRSKSMEDKRKYIDFTLKQTKPEPKPKKILIIEISSDVNNFLDDSYEKYSTYGDLNSSQNISDFDSISSFSSRRSRNSSMDFMMRCGICTSQPKTDPKADQKQMNSKKNYEIETTTNKIVNKSNKNGQKDSSGLKPTNNKAAQKTIINNCNNQKNVKIPKEKKTKREKKKKLNSLDSSVDKSDQDNDNEKDNSSSRNSISQRELANDEKHVEMDNSWQNFY